MPRKTYKKIIVTEERLTQVNPKNKELVTQFVQAIKPSSSAVTVSNYESDADIFFVWNTMFNGNKFFVDIRKQELINFFAYATDENELNWGSARANRVRSFLSSLSQYIERVLDDQYPNFRNIVLRAVKAIPKEQRREKTILTDQQIQGLLDYFSHENIQIACWIALAAYSGSRFSELLRFTTDIIDPNNTAFENIFIETKTTVRTKGRGKNGKLLYKYILRDKFLPYYNAWLVEREKILKETRQSHNALFIREDGSPAVSGTARSWVATIDRYLGIPFYAHAMRHFLCTELHRKRIPPLFIQNLFGWSTSEMTSLYNDLTIKDMVWTELSALK